MMRLSIHILDFSFSTLSVLITVFWVIISYLFYYRIMIDRAKPYILARRPALPISGILWQSQILTFKGPGQIFNENQIPLTYMQVPEGALIHNLG